MGDQMSMAKIKKEPKGWWVRVLEEHFQEVFKDRKGRRKKGDKSRAKRFR